MSVLVLAETAIQAVAILGRDEFTAGLRVMLLGCLSLKAVFVRGARHLRPGSAMGLLLFEATGAVVALAAATWATPVRLALGTSSVVAIGLLSASLHAFPTAELPKP